MPAVNDIQFGRALSIEVECLGIVDQNPAQYVAKRDGSLSTGGIEVVYTTEVSAEGKVSVPALDAVAHCRVDRTCGLHVHVDVRDVEPHRAGDVYDSIIRFQRVLKLLVPDSRIGNRYCRWNSNRGRGNRYAAINYYAYSKFRTFEFRCQAGSTNRSKIEAWAELCYEIVQWAKTAPASTRSISWPEFLAILTPTSRRWAISRRINLRHREMAFAAERLLDGQLVSVEPAMARELGRMGVPFSVARPARPAVARVRTSGQRWFGFSVSSVLRRLGAEGCSEQRALDAAQAMGIQVQPSTVRFMLNAGREGRAGAQARLTRAQVEEVMGSVVVNQPVFEVQQASSLMPF